MTRLTLRGLALLAAVLLLLVAATAVIANETFLDGKLRVGDNLDVPSSETVDGDLYLFAGTITVDGTIDGDLVTFGGTVRIDGTVQGDVLVGGGTVNIGGSVDGDVRTGAGQVTISGQVGEDVVIAGGQATLTGASQVDGDLLVTGGRVDMAGSVQGSIEGRAGSYSRSGSVGGSENITVAPRDADRGPFEGNAIVDALRHFVVVVLVGALALWLVPGGLRSADGALRRRPAPSFLGGIAAFVGYAVFAIAIVLVAVLLAIVFGLLRIGAVVAIDLVAGVLGLAIGTFVFVLAVAFVADVVVSMAIGRLAVLGGVASRWQELALLVAGAALVVIVTSLPVIGGIAKLLVVLFGLGAVVLAGYDAWRSRRSQPTRPAPPASDMSATA